MIIMTMDGKLYRGTALEIVREFTKLSFCESTVTDFVFGASKRAEHLTGKPIFPTGASESELADTFIAEALRVGVLRAAPLA